MMQEKKAFQNGKDKTIAARINRSWNNQALRNSLELYFKQCSIECSMLGCGLMAATLANAGVNPWSAERVFGISTVQSMLKIMLTCGMYDYSGEWLYRVGLPAKSGVGGLI